MPKQFVHNTLQDDESPSSHQSLSGSDLLVEALLHEHVDFIFG